MKKHIKVKQVLKKILPDLKKKYKIKQIGLFGSYAVGKETAKSDLDILVEFSRPIGWEFIDLKEYLEKSLKKEVDLVTKNALKPQLKNSILNQVVYI